MIRLFLISGLTGKSEVTIMVVMVIDTKTMVTMILGVGVCRGDLLRAKRHKVVDPLVDQESHLLSGR